jgi:hypothetical protein
MAAGSPIMPPAIIMEHPQKLTVLRKRIILDARCDAERHTRITYPPALIGSRCGSRPQNTSGLYTAMRPVHTSGWLCRTPPRHFKLPSTKAGGYEYQCRCYQNPRISNARKYQVAEDEKHQCGGPAIQVLHVMADEAEHWSPHTI